MLIFPLQVISLFPQLSSNCPNELIWIFRIASITNIDIELFGVECTSIQFNYWNIWRSKLLIPIAILFVLFCIYIVEFAAIRIRDIHRKPDINRYIYCGVSLLHTIYFPILRQLFQPVICKKLLDGTIVISNRNSEPCSGNEWNKSLYIVIVLGIIYILVIPTGFLIYMVRNRNSSTLYSRFGFLLTPYKNKFAWWEVFVFTKKFFIICLPSLISATTSVQVLVIFIVLFFSLVIEIFTKPFASNLRHQMNIM
jgi:hypothetical protein